MFQNNIIVIEISLFLPYIIAISFFIRSKLKTKKHLIKRKISINRLTIASKRKSREYAA